MSEELKPCPFCNKGKAKLSHDDVGTSWIECPHCGASTGDCDSEGKAIGSWNMVRFAVIPAPKPEPPKRKTCGDCGYCVKHVPRRDPDGGWFDCHAIPPTVTGCESDRPTVKEDDVACTLFKGEEE